MGSPLRRVTFLASCFLTLQLLSPAPPRRLAITGANLIDVRTGRIVVNALVVIEGERIAYAGPFRSDRIPAGAKRIEAPGKTIMPGLIDMHVHLNPPEVAPLLLSAGVTTARDLGSPARELEALLTAIAKGRLPGPRVYAFAPVSAQEHPPFAHRVSRRREIDPLLRDLTARHYRGVKVFDLPESLLPALVSSCRAQGLLTAAHIDRIPPRLVIESGIGTIEHIVFLASEWRPVDSRKQTAELMRAWIDPGPSSPRFDEMIASLKRNKTAVVPTLAALEAALDPDRLVLNQPGLQRLPPDLSRAVSAAAAKSPFTSGWEAEDYKSARHAFSAILSATGRLQRERIPILAGSDNLIPGFGVHREMQLLSAAGLSNLEVLQAMTCVPGALLSPETGLGIIETGSPADLLILAESPLQDIRAIETIEKVIKAGVVYDPHSLTLAARRDVLRDVSETEKKSTPPPAHWPGREKKSKSRTAKARKQELL